MNFTLKENTIRTSLFVGVAALWAGSVYAQAESPPALPETRPMETAPAEVPATVSVEPVAPSAPAERKWYDKVKFEGLVDSYYGYRLNTDPTAIRASSELRAFDGFNHAFTVAYAELSVSIPAEPAGLRIDLGFGTVADATATDFAAPPGALAVFRNIQQAYASIKLFNLLTIDAGKFVTSAGAEVIEAKDNWLYSRSLLFTWAIPFAHTGVRLGLPLGDALSVSLQVTNGWDSQLSALTFKTFGVTALLALPSATTIAFNFYGGPVNSPELRLLFDLVISQNIGDKFAINLNGDFGTEAGSSWYGAALMAKLMVLENLRLAARFEYFADPASVRTGVVQTSGTGGASFISATVGLGIVFGFSGIANAEIRPEFRVDLAQGATPFVGGTQASQLTAQLAFLAWF